MEEDYGNQINGLKDQIREKIEIINKLMEDQETVTTVPAPSSRVFRKEFQCSILAMNYCWGGSRGLISFRNIIRVPESISIL